MEESAVCISGLLGYIAERWVVGVAWDSPYSQHLHTISIAVKKENVLLNGGRYPDKTHFLRYVSCAKRSEFDKHPTMDSWRAASSCTRVFKWCKFLGRLRGSMISDPRLWTKGASGWNCTASNAAQSRWVDLPIILQAFLDTCHPNVDPGFFSRWSNEQNQKIFEASTCGALQLLFLFQKPPCQSFCAAESLHSKFCKTREILDLASAQQ